MEERSKIQYQELLVAKYETGSVKFITGEDLELWYRDKIKGTVHRKLEFDEALQEAFTKFVQRRF